MAATGMKNTEIAKLLNITPQTVSNTINSELGMKRMSELRGERDSKYGEVSERISFLTQRALDVYEGVLAAEKDDPEINLTTRLKVSDTVMLELSGHRAAQKVHSVNTSATLDEISEFKKRGIKAAQESGMLVVLSKKDDGTYETTEVKPA